MNLRLDTVSIKMDYTIGRTGLIKNQVEEMGGLSGEKYL